MLEARNLAIGHGKRRLLEGLDLSVRPGELLAVLGPNGAGKTTLIKALAHLLPPCAGALHLDGISLTGLSRPERARQVAYLPQQNEVAPVTVFEAVLLGRLPHLGWQVGEADLARVEDILARLGLTDLAGRADIADQIQTEMRRTAADSRFSDCIHLPELGDHPDDQAVLQYAMGREHAAMSHYGQLAETSPPGLIKDLFTYLASEETKHKLELEKLYYETVHRGGGV